MTARFVDFSESQIFVFALFSRIITSAILLKQLVTSGSVNIAIVTSISSRWLFADIHVAFGDQLLNSIQREYTFSYALLYNRIQRKYTLSYISSAIVYRESTQSYTLYFITVYRQSTHLPRSSSWASKTTQVLSPTTIHYRQWQFQ